MFGAVSTIVSSLVMLGGSIKGFMVSNERREIAENNNEDFYFDNKNIPKSVRTNEPLYNSIRREKSELIGAKTGNVYKTIDYADKRFDDQKGNYDCTNRRLKEKDQNFYWKYNPNWDYMNKKCKKIMVWGQVDKHNGKYINNIIPVSKGFDIIYADENHYGIKSIVVNGKSEIDHRIITNEDYKLHYAMFRRQSLV